MLRRANASMMSDVYADLFNDVELRGFEPCLDLRKYGLTCTVVPSRSSSVPLVTCGFVLGT
jgi:hypothetical protein